MTTKLQKHLLKDKKNYKIFVLSDINAENSFLNDVGIALKEGVDVVEFDGNNLVSKDFLSTGKKLRDLCGVFNALLIIKDRIDIAKLVGADGVALDKNSVSISEAHKLVEDNLLLGFHAQERTIPDEHELSLLNFLVPDNAINADIKQFQPQ
ncbi:MAG: thiamine phosphate synthase [bacterium]|nr:thiamine phosphate synthase [bacterium]